MDEKHIIVTILGPIFFLIGFFLSASPRFAAWGLSWGRARVWVRMFGHEGAMAVTRYLFGPFVMIMGVFAVYLGLYSK